MCRHGSSLASVSPTTPVVVRGSDFENHRTATEYEDSLVAKLFSFTFCNSYGGFMYLAFVGEPVVGVACERSCMSLLATNLTIVFGVQLLVSPFTLFASKSRWFLHFRPTIPTLKIEVCG